MVSKSSLAWLVVVLAICFLIACGADVAAAQVKITSPQPKTAGHPEVIVLRGSGAKSGDMLRVEVLTNQWYLQNGKADINPDGTWSYGPCSISGQDRFNNHTIKVTLLRDGKVVSSDIVEGVVRGAAGSK